MKYSFIICVSNFNKFKKLTAASLEAILSGSDDAETVVLDNTANLQTVPEVLNEGIRRAKGDILIVCHQDVYFPPDWLKQLNNQIMQVEKMSSNWAVLGVYGISLEGEPRGHIVDRGVYLQSYPLPCPVQSLDEVCIIIRRQSNLWFNEQLASHHLYATDLCLQAKLKKLPCYAIDAMIEHISSTSGLDDSFEQAVLRFKSYWKHNVEFVCTPCANIRLKNSLSAYLSLRQVKRKQRLFKKKVKKGHIKTTLDIHNQPNNYYSSFRKEMIKYVYNKPQTTLELGMGDGFFSYLVKEKWGCQTWGIEHNPSSAQRAKRLVDFVFCGDAFSLIEQLPDSHFDTIFCFDLLEHLFDPFTLLINLKKKFSSDGILVASIPNIRYYKTLKELIFQKDWCYKDAGTLDITHLRFFTYKSIERMFNELGYQIIKIEGINPTRNKKLTLLNLLTAGFFSDLKYRQFAIVAKPK